MSDELEALVDYIRFARDCLSDMLCEPDLLDKWTRGELAEVADAADRFADAYTKVKRGRQDREILASWLNGWSAESSRLSRSVVLDRRFSVNTTIKH
jgi:hypothetical protein